jgi:hypothetical protein
MPLLVQQTETVSRITKSLHRAQTWSRVSLDSARKLVPNIKHDLIILLDLVLSCDLGSML